MWIAARKKRLASCARQKYVPTIVTSFCARYLDSLDSISILAHDLLSRRGRTSHIKGCVMCGTIKHQTKQTSREQETRTLRRQALDATVQYITNQLTHRSATVPKYHTMRHCFSLLLSGFFLPSIVTAFQSPPPRPVQLSFTRVSTTSHPRQHIVRNMSAEELEEDEEGTFILTPKQLLALRKEANKRKAAKQIVTLSVTPEETQGPFSHDTLSAIALSLSQHELVQVRGISSNDKKRVREFSELLAFNLEMETEKMVVSIEVKGFAATLYCPMEDGNPDKIKLFSSFRPNQWNHRPRAIRDNRGQIITDEDGEIIRK